VSPIQKPFGPSPSVLQTIAAEGVRKVKRSMETGDRELGAQGLAEALAPAKAWYLMLHGESSFATTDAAATRRPQL
jgi:hypothetical protein